MNAKLLGSALALLVCASAPVDGQQSSVRSREPLTPTPRSAADIYHAACATCHAPDGRGAAKGIVGFDVPLPDFTDCAFASAEPDPDWHAVVHEGGPVRGLDRHMPAFGDALSEEEIALAVSHVRTFCAEPVWPRGDLNLPRAFFTEKAFPENEAIWVTSLTRSGERSIINDLIYERRLGARSQLELTMPIALQQGEDDRHWRRGLGDVSVAFKRTLYADLPSGGIGSAGMEVILPTGKETLGLGNGYTVFEPFAMWGQILPRNSFFQLHGGLEIPSDSKKGARELYFRTAVGTTLAQNRGFGRAWSPQLELLWARPQAEPSEWDLVPQIQVTLSKLQHVMVAGAVRIPLSQRGERPRQALVYLLWDWFDGGFFEFWK